MITDNQIENLARDYQINKFTIMREYLQLLFLSYLYQHKSGKEIYFKGGTAIRLLLGSPRFSEDLDFSTSCTKLQIKQLMSLLVKSLQKELPDLQILPLYSGVSGIRFRIKYQAPHFKYPLTIRLDFNLVKKIGQFSVSPLVTKFPITIFPLVSHLPDWEILAEKLCALATRSKGRDLFDIWYLLEKGVTVDKKQIKFSKEYLIKRIESFPQKQLDLDLAQFLPKSQKEIVGMLIGLLKNKLGENFGLSAQTGKSL